MHKIINKLRKSTKTAIFAAMIFAIALVGVPASMIKAAATPLYNGYVEGFVDMDETTGAMFGATSGDYITTISGNLVIATYVEGQRADFTGTITGDINGSLTGGVNWNGFDTLSAEIFGTGATGHVYMIGYFEGDPGHFFGYFITTPSPIDFTTDITITGGDTVELGQTLQLYATTDGGSQDVAWSIWTGPEPSFGSATINQNTGLLTATGVGKVIVIASALDGSLVTKNHTVTITPDVTPPSAPTWGTIYKGHGVDPSKEIDCGGYTNTTQVTFEWNENAESDLAGYWFGTQFNTKHQWFPAGSTVKTANMKPGYNPYYYTLIAVDNADNESAVSEKCYLTLDQEDPVAPNLLSPSNGAFVNGSPTQTWSSVADADHYVYESYVDEALTIPIYETVVNGTSRTVGGTQNITFWWHVKAVDAAGNESAWSDAWKMTIDNTAPTINNLMIDKTLVKAGDVITITADVTDLSGIAAVSADFAYNTAYTNRPSPKKSVTMHHVSGNTYSVSYTVPASWNEGTVYIKVAARDGTGGNWIRSIETEEVTVDNTAPYVEITSPLVSLINTNGEVRVTATDANLRHYWVKITKDGTIVFNKTILSSGVTNHLVYTATDDGVYEVTLAARDTVGGGSNTGNRSANVTKTFTIDKTAPTLELVTPQHGDIVSGTVELKATCDEECNYVNFWWRAEGESYSNVSPDRRYHYVHDNGTEFTWDLDTLAAELWGSDGTYLMNDGAYYMYAATKDLAGNWVRTPEIAFTVDNTAPTAAITDPLDGAYVNGVVTITATADDGTGSGIDRVEFWHKNLFNNFCTDNDVNDGISCDWDTVGLSDGPHTIYVMAYDKAGNFAASTYIDLNVDTIAPVITLLGDNPVTLTVGETYVDAGATALDAIEGDLTPAISVFNPVDTSVAGTYAITYDVTDSAGNAATTVTRTVQVNNPPALSGTTGTTVGGGAATFVAGATAPTPTPSATPTPSPTPVDKNGSLTESLGTTNEEDTGGMPLWWLWIVGAVVVLGGLWWFLAFRKNLEDK